MRAVILAALLLCGCSEIRPAAVLDLLPDAPAGAVAKPAAPAAKPAPATGSTMADGVSNATAADVVGWLRPWLAGLLTIATVGLVVVAAWLRSRSLAMLAAGCAAGLALVLVLKLVLWILAGLLGVAFLAGLSYLVRELIQHRRALAKYDPLHALLTRAAPAAEPPHATH